MGRSFRLAYFSPRVREEIESWPVDLLARCDELLDLLEDHGPRWARHTPRPSARAYLNSGPKAAAGLAGRSSVIAVAA